MSDHTRRIRHTLDKDQPVNLTGGPFHVAFPAAGVLTVDADRAADLVEHHPLVEYAVQLPEDYQTLQRMAAAADSDVVDGNSSRSAIEGYLETLANGELEDLHP